MSGKYNFIKIQKIIIRNFSLYSKDNKVIEIEEEINNGVYCLAGANGLGKTTFLNAVNYGLTGIVLEPNKEVLTPEDIIKSNKFYTERYFQGRINAFDKEKSEIELLISVNNKFIRIVRGFSNRDELRVFEYYESKENRKISLMDTNNLSPKELLSKYEEVVSFEVGIMKFSYFMFFQLYVLTFDENRRMLFWDPRASTNALSIAFNDDLADTERVLRLKKEMEDYESYGRNTRWQATQIKKEIDKLISENSQKGNIDWQNLKTEFDKLYLDVESSEKTYVEINTEYDTLLKRQNIINSEILHLKIEYKRLFSEYSEPRSKLTNNPYIKLAEKEQSCFLCGAQGNHIIENIERKLNLDSCPVCDTKLSSENNEDQSKLLETIKRIDKELAKKMENLDELIYESETKKLENDRASHNFDTSKQKLSRFEKNNSKISFEKTGESSIDVLIDEYQRQFDKLDMKAIHFYKKRDELNPEYDNLIKKINTGYKVSEKQFVELFKKIAYSFIGVNLNIYPIRKGRNFTLYFEMKETARTASYQLSESQRFFLDIALRMTLAVYLSKKDNEATMFIDTPEGSLDIAYEDRVGQMFAEYVIEYNQNIIMTANINASQLLISLAEKCKQSKMKFRRMLEWTDLSDIQKKGEYLFDRVYNNIEDKLKTTE